MVNLNRAERVRGRYVNAVPTGVGGFSTLLKALPLYLNNKEEKTPRKAPGPFRTDAGVYGRAPESGLRGAGLRVTWMGHSSMLVEVDGVRVLVDPVWDARASPVQWAGPKRFFEAPLRLEEMPRLDAVLISHDHYDHLGSTTVRRLAELPGMAATRWVTSAGVGEILRKFGVQAERITELNWTESTVLTGASGAEVKVTAVPARHFSGRGVTNRFETLWSSFVLRGPEHNVYFGADSGWWEGFAAIGAAYGPFDLTMLEIGAYHELWEQIHLGPDGAVRAFEALGGTGLLMPIHWGLFDLALHGWRQPIERLLEVAEAKGISVWSPEPGKPVEVVRGETLVADWWRHD